MEEMETVGLKRCENCGQERDVMVSGFCVPCEIEIRSREKERDAKAKPQFLESMEHLVGNGQPRNDVERSFHTMLMKRPQDFLSRLSSLQNAYTERYKALQAIEEARRPQAPQPAGDNPLSPDEGQERVEELIERLLKEAGS